MSYDKNFEQAVEYQFIRFMQETSLGIKKDYYRKQTLHERRTRALCEFSAELSDFLQTNSTVRNDSLHEYENETLSLALETLTSRQRNILLKVSIEGWKEKEVAELLGKSQQYINRTKSKAIDKVKTHFKETFDI